MWQLGWNRGRGIPFCNGYKVCGTLPQQEEFKLPYELSMEIQEFNSTTRTGSTTRPVDTMPFHVPVSDQSVRDILRVELRVALPLLAS